jgi:outer membrane protein TolC
MPMLASLLVSSCTKIGNYAEERADRAAYGNIRGAQLAGMGKADAFTIGKTEKEIIRELLEADRSHAAARVLSLADTLAIAMANSRSYKFQKEGLFIQALNLTTTQKDFNWDYSASADARTSMTTFDDGTTESFGDNGVNSTLQAGVERTLASGARVSLGLTQNFVNLLTDPDTSDANNALSFSLVQPLLNGFGPLVTMEPLRQAERDMVYAVREFKRFQQDFVIDIASRYYSVLRTRDQMINQRSRFESAKANRERNESLVRAGKIPDFQASQSRLSELNAVDGWTLSKANYEAALDDFRFTLGLPIEVNVEPDPRELELLAERGLVELDITLDDALGYAVSNRLDLISKRQRVEDKERKLDISRRNFLPNLDVDYDVTKSFENDTGEDVSQDLAVRLNLPLDWTEKRNAYRKAQIALDQEKRELAEDLSDLKRNVRDLWRKLERNRSVYENRRLSVELSQRTVEQTSLLLKQGKALTRDLLDAEDDLTDAKNARTLALVDFTINRLRFWNAIERFEVDPKGMWYEESNTETPVAKAQK